MIQTKGWIRLAKWKVAVIALALALGGVAGTPQPASADHQKPFSRWQQSRDNGSCCIDVRAVTKCGGQCKTINAAIRWQGQLLSVRCNGECGGRTIYGVYRGFSYPVTVSTLHELVSSCTWMWDCHFSSDLDYRVHYG